MQKPESEMASVGAKVLSHSENGRFLKHDHWIGRGSFKKVYRGWDSDRKQNIAWCEIPLLDGEPGSKKKAMKEISVLSSVNNPHVLKLFASWEDTKLGTVVLATELMTGGSIKGYGKCPSLVIRNWGRQILLGLQALHSNKPSPILHRDLKCKNILIDKASGTVKIGDLGLAKLKSIASQTRSDSKVSGTFVFQAPEASDGDINELSDVYSFGLCLLELSTGDYPYEEYRGKDMQLLKAKMKGTLPQSLKTVNDYVLKDIIETCIKTDFKDRYSVTKLLSHKFFENAFQVTVHEESHITNNNSKITLNIQDTRKDSTGVPAVQVTYDLNCQAPTSITEKLVYGKVAEADHTAVMDALIEKVEVLTLLSQSKNGVGEVQGQTVTDSGIGMDTRYSITTDRTSSEASITAKVEELNVDTMMIDENTAGTGGGNGRTQLDDGDRCHTKQTPSSSNLENVPSLSDECYDNYNNEDKQHRDSQSTGDDHESLTTLQSVFNSSPTPTSTPSTSYEYDFWRANISKVTPFIESNLMQVATALNAKGLIPFGLQDNVVTPTAGLTESEKITLLFDIIQRKLENSDAKIVETTWKAFTTAVAKLDSRYKKIKLELESLAKNKNILEAFKSYKEKLCLLLQSSVGHLTEELWSAFAITDDEKRQVTEGTYHYEQKWTKKMIDEISKQIKSDPAVFKQVVETFKKVEGLKKATEKHLTL